MLNYVVDLAKNPGMDIDALTTFLDDMKRQPAWRVVADVEADYYDGNQLDPTTVAELEARGLPTVVVNLIHPTINMVLGMEAKTRTDWLVKPAGSGHQNDLLAEALTVKHKEMSRLSRAHKACANAYSEQIKVGMGWVEVSRESDPFRYPYRVRRISRRQIWWDSRSEEEDLVDCRYLVRRKWHDVDVLKAVFPKWADLIDYSINAEAHWDPSQFTHSYPYLRDNLIERDWGLDEADWRDSNRRRGMLYEVWYRKWVRGHVLKSEDGRVVEYDARNPMHQAAVATKYLTPIPASYPKMRMSWWLGPIRFIDMATPYNHNNFPYIPFFGFREDRTYVPYGLIRGMKPLQDEVNARRQKMLWQLSAKQVIADEDAVHDWNKVDREISRPDARILLNKNRIRSRFKDRGFEIREHQGLTEQQYQVYVDSKDTIQDVAGVWKEMLGKEGGAESGVAISRLIEQGTTTLAEINDNFAYSKQLVGEQMSALLMEDLGTKLEQVELEPKGGQKRTVILNEPKKTRQGLPYRNNDVVRAKMRVAMAPVPATATYRDELMNRLTELTKSLPPELQALVMDIWVEASDLPDKEIIAQRIRKFTGVESPRDPQDMSPEERQQLEQGIEQAEQEAAEVAELAELEKDKLAAEAEELRAKAAKDKAYAANKNLESGLPRRTFIDEEPPPTQRDSVPLLPGPESVP